MPTFNLSLGTAVITWGDFPKVEPLSGVNRGWKTGRPIYHRLPIESGAYQGNVAVDAITKPFDQILMEYKSLLLHFEANYLNPDTALPENLDWLAQLCGYTGEYWDTAWTPVQKRKLIKNSHQFVWRNKGTRELLEWLLNDVFDLGASIFQPGSFRLDVNRIGETLGGDALIYFIVMPLKFRTTSREWKLAERLDRLYMPCFCESVVVYDQFYLDQSALGHPLMS